MSGSLDGLEQLETRGIESWRFRSNFPLEITPARSPVTWSLPSPSFPHLPQPNPHNSCLPNIRQINLGLHGISAVTILLFHHHTLLFETSEEQEAALQSKSRQVLKSGRFRCGLQGALVPGLARFAIEIWSSCKDGATIKGWNCCLFTTIYQTKALMDGSSMIVKNKNLKSSVVPPPRHWP